MPLFTRPLQGLTVLTAVENGSNVRKHSHTQITECLFQITVEWYTLVWWQAYCSFCPSCATATLAPTAGRIFSCLFSHPWQSVQLCNHWIWQISPPAGLRARGITKPAKLGLHVYGKKDTDIKMKGSLPASAATFTPTMWLRKVKQSSNNLNSQRLFECTS